MTLVILCGRLSLLNGFLADLSQLIYARRSLLQLIYARPCNWLVIPWPQLGYSSISILCRTLYDTIMPEHALNVQVRAEQQCPKISIIHVFSLRYFYNVSLPYIAIIFFPRKTFFRCSDKESISLRPPFLWTKTYHLSKLPWYMQCPSLFVICEQSYKCVWGNHWNQSNICECIVHCADVINMQQLNLELTERHQICLDNINRLDNSPCHLQFTFVHFKPFDLLLVFATVLFMIGVWTFARFIERLLLFIFGFLLAC